MAARRLKLLVSVRTPEEALAVAQAGVDFIDLKEPRSGALGALPLGSARAIVEALRGTGAATTTSATIGDIPVSRLADIVAGATRTGSIGVDIVKVGIDRQPGAGAVVQALARMPLRIVPVFIADRGFDWEVVELAAALPFEGLMLDTADKHRGSVLDALPTPLLTRFIDTARRAGKMVGVAGALRQSDLPRLLELAPDFAGFRSAVCDGDRGSRLDPSRVRGLVVSCQQAAQAGAGVAVDHEDGHVRSRGRPSESGVDDTRGAQFGQ